VPARITFVTQSNKSTQPNDISMEVDDSNTDVESKKHIVSPIKQSGNSIIIVPEDDSSFENMDVDEPKECNFQESIRRKRPLEVVSIQSFKINDYYLYNIIYMFV